MSGLFGLNWSSGALTVHWPHQTSPPLDCFPSYLLHCSVALPVLGLCCCVSTCVYKLKVMSLLQLLSSLKQIVSFFQLSIFEPTLHENENKTQQTYMALSLTSLFPTSLSFFVFFLKKNGSILNFDRTFQTFNHEEQQLASGNPMLCISCSIPLGLLKCLFRPWLVHSDNDSL